VYGAGKHNSIDNLPKLREGDTLAYGHTHIKVNEQGPQGVWLFNPGSVGIPKDGTHSYGLYCDGTFEHVVLEGRD
jgi:predicted phosphodiesterase